MAALKQPAALLALAMAAALCIILTLHYYTADAIRHNRLEYQNQQLRAVLADVPHDATLPPPAPLDIQLAHSRLRAVYRVYNGATLAAVVIHAESEGYNGALSLLLAYADSGKPPALRIIDHRETAGIADFLTTQPQRVFDGVSGATITTAAIVRTVTEVGEWVEVSGEL